MDTIKLDSEFTKGETRQVGKHGWVTITSTSQQYIREDGQSFGLRYDSGYLHSAVARRATDEEIEQAQERQRLATDAETARRNNVLCLQAIYYKIQRGKKPPKSNTLPDNPIYLTPSDERSSVYGGGRWFAIDAEYIWAIKNNAGDGDDWSNNNLPGCIGWRKKSDQSLADEIRR